MNQRYNTNSSSTTSAQQQPNLLAFLYDIPRDDSYTPGELQQIMRKLTGYDCSIQIITDAKKPMLTARVKFECEAHMQLALSLHRTVPVKNGRYLRLHPFEPSYKAKGFTTSAATAGTLDPEVETECNVYLRGIDRDWTHKDLYEIFGEYGTIVSAKVSVHPLTGRSNGYGYILFKDRASALHAIQASIDGETPCTIEPYKPCDSAA